MRFDQSQMLQAKVLLAAASYNSDNDPEEVTLDKAQSATILISVGDGGITFTDANKIEFKLTHGDTPGGAFTAVEQDDIVGATVGEGGIIRALVDEHATPSVAAVGYKGRRSILRLLADFSGTHGSPTPMSAVVVLGNLERIAPA